MAIFLEILTFLAVLIVLILVHELGHLIVAKLSGMRVDEFGFGYPPRALVLAKVGGTEYTLNWLPFGGFVRIYGEDEIPEKETLEKADTETETGAATAFSVKPRILQALVLVAGIVMNLLFAYVLFTATLIMGVEQPLSDDQIAQAKNVSVAVTDVRPGTPAARAGFMPGDKIKSEMVINKLVGISYDGTNPLGYTTLTGMDTNGLPIVYKVNRNGKIVTLTATPQTGIVPSDPTRPAVGFGITTVGTIKTPLAKAPVEGARLTWEMTKATAAGLFHFFKNIVLLKPDLSQVSGPVGIANVVGSAAAEGIVPLLTLTALISINLAIINLLPIPALDGGRLVFVLIEAIIRRPLHPKIAQRANAIGFAFLIILMFVISAHDIFKLFG